MGYSYLYCSLFNKYYFVFQSHEICQYLELMFQSRRVQSADSLPSVKHNSRPIHSASSTTLTMEEARMVRYARAQFERRGGFIRIFPSAESWKRYSAYLGRE